MMLMSMVTVAATTLLFAVCSGDDSSTSAPVKKAYQEECAVDNDCENAFKCNSGTCTCSYGEVISSDRRTCLDAAVYGDPCNETAQCVAHIEHSTCGSQRKCQCEAGFRYADTWGDHSCLPAGKHGEACLSAAECGEPFTNCTSHHCDCPDEYTVSKDKLKCEPGSGSSSTPLSVWRVILGCVLSSLMSAATR